MSCPKATSSPAPCLAGFGMLMSYPLQEARPHKYPGSVALLLLLPGTTDPLGLNHILPLVPAPVVHTKTLHGSH